MHLVKKIYVEYLILKLCKISTGGVFLFIYFYLTLIEIKLYCYYLSTKMKKNSPKSFYHHQENELHLINI